MTDHDNQQEKLIQELNEKLSKLTDEEREFVREAVLAEEIFELVVSELNIPEEDELYQNMVIGMLKKQAKDHVILSIWNNLDDKMAIHLREFINQSVTVYPDKENDEILIEFALLYPELMGKIYKSLSEFFAGFIKKFNEINGS